MRKLKKKVKLDDLEMIRDLIKELGEKGLRQLTAKIRST